MLQFHLFLSVLKQSDFNILIFLSFEIFKLNYFYLNLKTDYIELIV